MVELIANNTDLPSPNNSVPQLGSALSIGRGSPSVETPSERINNTFGVAFVLLKTASASFNVLHIGILPEMYGLMVSMSSPIRSCKDGEDVRAKPWFEVGRPATQKHVVLFSALVVVVVGGCLE